MITGLTQKVAKSGPWPKHARNLVEHYIAQTMKASKPLGEIIQMPSCDLLGLHDAGLTTRGAILISVKARDLL